MNKKIVGKLIKNFIRCSTSKSLLSTILVFLFFIILGSFHLYKFVVTKDANWVGSFGAVLTVYSLFKCFSNSIYPSFQEDAKPRAAKGGGVWVALPDSGVGLGIVIPEENAKELNDKHQVYIYEKYKEIVVMQFLSIIGTLIWAYAFLIP